MKKYEKEQLKCDINASHLLAQSAIWESLSVLNYYAERSENANYNRLPDIIRKLNLAKENIDKLKEYVTEYKSL
jgi:hypothetical protein